MHDGDGVADELEVGAVDGIGSGVEIGGGVEDSLGGSGMTAGVDDDVGTDFGVSLGGSGTIEGVVDGVGVDFGSAFGSTGVAAGADGLADDCCPPGPLACPPLPVLPVPVLPLPCGLVVPVLPVLPGFVDPPLLDGCDPAGALGVLSFGGSLTTTEGDGVGVAGFLLTAAAGGMGVPACLAGMALMASGISTSMGSLPYVTFVSTLTWLACA